MKISEYTIAPISWGILIMIFMGLISITTYAVKISDKADEDRARLETLENKQEVINNMALDIAVIKNDIGHIKEKMGE